MANTKETKITANGTIGLGVTAIGSGRVTVYVRYVSGTGTVTFGYFKKADIEGDPDDFVPVATPAAVTATAIVAWEVGANMSYGIVVSGATSLVLRVLSSNSY